MPRIRKIINGKQYSFSPDLKEDELIIVNANHKKGHPRNGEAATHKIGFRVTPKEKDIIERNAWIADKDVGVYCRDLALEELS